MTIRIENGNCLELMKNLDDKSVDLMICDLPYGETNCKWDCKIDLDEFWKEFKRIRKSKKTACIHFCSTKFGYTLIKSNEAMFKMDMVWKKRNKTGGLQSRNRPMRNHEMIYFFYEQAPKYNRDKYHKRIQAPPTTEKKTKIVEEKDERINEKGKSAHGWDIEHMDKPRVAHFDPKLPASVLEEKFSKEYYETNKTGMTKTDIYSKEQIKKYHKENGVGFEPPNPASVVEEKEEITKLNNPCDGKISKLNSIGIDLNKHSAYANKPNFTPLLPASVVEESDEDVWGATKFKCGGDCGRLNEDGSYKMPYDPPNPPSVFESNKVFIGKRHHQTEKPQDILEFFIKYWSDEGETILDPTMGSGSTGVACKGLNRNFIGFELNDKIYNVAEERINKTEKLI